MTAHSVNVLSCDKPACSEQITGTVSESTSALRRRAARESGWRSVPSFAAGGHTDTCRWHA